MLKRLLIASLLILPATAATASSLDELLLQVKASNKAELNIDEAAVSEFKQNLATQTANLNQQKRRNKQLERSMARLQDTISENNDELRAQQKRANEEKADLDKVFAEFRRASQDLRGQLKKTALSVSLPNRSAQLAPFSEGDFQADSAAMKQLWLLFSEQMVASSKVSTQSLPVIMPTGEKATLPVMQVAGITAFTQQGPLLYLPENESYQLLANTSADVQQRIAAFSEPRDGFLGILVDPSGGGLLERATQDKAWWQVFSDAGVVGGIIVLVGLLGLGVGMTRWLTLSKNEKLIKQQKVRTQRASSDLSSDNPLGRILSVANRHDGCNADELSRHLDEAILTELPDCRKGLGTIAVLATVAPLLGLLGTVAGMIETFQAITAYGNSDPQVLSNGISQALLTTKFGLIAAVPLMLLHSLLSSKSDGIVHIIEHQSAGLLAQCGQDNTPDNHLQPVLNKA